MRSIKGFLEPASVSLCFSISKPLLAIASVGAAVLPLIMLGMIEASIMESPLTPRTFNEASTTDASSNPIRHVPTGCHIVAMVRQAWSATPSSVEKSGSDSRSLLRMLARVGAFSTPRT